jgi:broad specificity phosphatase PhoE
MKPKRIYLIRHGESIGNINRETYKDVPDWKIPLTKRGHEQAKAMALRLSKTVPVTEPVRIYCSPYYRTRETAMALRRIYKHVTYREDPRIREQEWGNFKEDELTKKIDKERDGFGTFFYRIPFGESGADGFDRVSGFLDSLYRSFESPTYEDTVFIVGHGYINRILLMRWFHWTIEEFEALGNPKNCGIIKLVLNKKNRFEIVTKLKKKIR